MKLRLANKQDLIALKQMFGDIITEMHKHEINIWNEFYPFEEFDNDIDQSRLYLLADQKNIYAAFVLADSIDGVECFEWANRLSRVKYLCRIGVNVDFLHRGIGTQAILEAINILKQIGYEYLRLTVAQENIPAINLYLKNNFKKVKGEFNEFSESQNKFIKEIGFELKVS